MGSKKKLAQKLERAKHANSRRTLAVIRDIKKINKREKIKGEFATKVNKRSLNKSGSNKLIEFILQANIEGKKLLFFSEKIEEIDRPLTPEEFEAIIEE